MSETNRVFELEGTINPDGLIVPLHFGLYKRLFRLAGLMEEGVPVRISVTKLVRQRSLRQNAYLWGVIVPTVSAWMRETEGVKYTPDEVYTWLRLSLLDEKPVVKEIAGLEVIVMAGKRFSAMSTAEFSEAVDTIIRKMAERGCVVPLPKGENLLTDFVVDD